jgi:hypothetical protein
MNAYRDDYAVASAGCRRNRSGVVPLQLSFLPPNHRLRATIQVNTAMPVLEDAEEFWADLLAFIEGGQVLPVVGPELLTLSVDGQPVPLYRVVAKTLIDRYRLPAAPSLRDGRELFDAVSALAASGKRVRDLYRPVHDILDRLVADHHVPVAPLRQLASMFHFDLFATTTPDTLLARELNAIRFADGRGRVDEIEYAPKLPTERRRDIPALVSSGYTAVFYLFGKADVSPLYAIHDEDALEFPYTLQAGNGPERMFSQLRSRNLLLIGCNFGDWLSRFFLRLSNSERLFSDQRSKKEFFIGERATDDRNFVTFLERFSQDSWCYPIAAEAFVTELHARWSARNPQPQAAPHGSEEALAQLQRGSIFISYASEDVEAARQLLAELREIGGDVAWFDKSALRPGDEWERFIAAAIQRCSLFLPLISTNTEKRTEGYFRWEWNEAVERSKRIEGRRFIVPVVVDAQPTSGLGQYELLPDRFKALHFSHAPGGRLSGDLKADIREHLRGLERARVS